MAKVSQWFKWGLTGLATLLGFIWLLLTQRRSKKVGYAKAEFDQATEKHEEVMADIDEKQKRDDAQSLADDAQVWAERKRQGW